MKIINFRGKLNNLNKLNIALIGHMGSGKSIIGRIISQKLKAKHYDSDSEITNSENKTISKIFEEKGEKYFRKTEAKIILDLLEKKNSIISLGGGAILNKQVRQKLKSNSITVFLNVNFNQLIKRLEKTNKRPLLHNTDIKIKLKELDMERRRYYLKADIIISNANTINKTYINFIKDFNSLHDKED